MMHRLSWLAPGLVVLLSALTGSLPAQAGFTEGEKLALDEYQRGDIPAARKQLWKLFVAATGDADAAATAEFHIVLWHWLGKNLADRRRDVEALEKSLSSEFVRKHPALADRVRQFLMQSYGMLGVVGRRVELRQELGYLTRWWILGALDNERGGGFRRSFAPEKKLDLGAAVAGKKRLVRWRRVPAMQHDGMVDLGALMRPTQQVLGYAATTIHSKTAQNVALHLGSGGAFVVFVNGREVARREVRRDCRHDQDAVTLPLLAGANLLLLKICTQERNFAFSARVRGMGGTPAKGTREGELESDLDKLVAQGSGKPEGLPTPFQGGRTTLQARFDKSKDPADAYRLATILLDRRPDDETSDRTMTLAQAACEGMPQSTAARELRIDVRDRGGKTRAERNENPTRHDLLWILEKNPKHVPALLRLARLELSSTGASQSAERLARRALAVREDNLEAWSVLAIALGAAGLDELARDAMQRAGTPDEEGNVRPGALAERASLLEQRGRLRDAIALNKQLLERRFSSSLAQEIGLLLMKIGEEEAALALMQRCIQTYPTLQSPRIRLAHFWEARHKPERALEELRAWLAICPEDDYALLRAGHMHGLVGRRDQQRELMRAALELNPNRKRERRYLEFLESGTKPFYAGLELDAKQVIAKDPGPPSDAREANDPFYYLLRQRVVHAYRNGTTSEYQHVILRILNQEGVKTWSGFRVPYWWGEQRARLLSARVVKRSGDEQRPRMRGTSVRMPPLEPGDLIELRWRVDDTAPSFFGDYFGLQHGFAANDGVPTNRSDLVAVLDPGRKYSIQVRNGAPAAEATQDKTGQRTLRYRMNGLPRRKPEERRPSATEDEPLVRITTYENWNAFSSWWWNLIRKQSEVSPAMRAKVAELTKGLSTEREKIEAIYKFVTTDVRYEAWEFGVHGYKPYSTPVIFERRHGDCKDKSLLLGAMLAEVGIKAYPVLIHAENNRSKDDLSVPLIAHFNHCISYLPASKERAEMFLDGTATYHPIAIVPEMDYGADVLVVKEGRAELKTIPWPSPAQNLDRMRFDVTLAETGNATVNVKLLPTGNRAVRMREYLGNEPAKREERLERMLGSRLGKLKIEKVQVSDLLDMTKTATVEVWSTVQALLDKNSNDLVVRPALWSESLQSMVSAKERKHALLLGTPGGSTQTVRYRMPKGFAPVELPKPTNLDNAFGHFSVTWKFDNGILDVTRSRTFKTNRIEPKDYAAFRDFITELSQVDNQIVLLRKGGAR